MSTATAIVKPNTNAMRAEATIADFKPGPKICANPAIAGDAALWRRGYTGQACNCPQRGRG